MKRKICVALLTLSGGLMMVFAAQPAAQGDKCTEKFEECKVVCGNDKARCRARGATPEFCDNAFAGCNAACNKALKDCQAKSGMKPAPSPSPAAPKKPSKK